MEHYDITTEEEMEMAMAWAEEEIESYEEARFADICKADNEAASYDELVVKLTHEDVMVGIGQLYQKGDFPISIQRHIDECFATRAPGSYGFAYTTIHVPSAINGSLANITTDESHWFDPRRVMPELNERVTKLIIGHRGHKLKEYTPAKGGIFIWFDKTNEIFRIWGYSPDYYNYSVSDVRQSLLEAIDYQTKRAYETALSRLHRSSERRHRERRRAGRLVYEVVDAEW